MTLWRTRLGLLLAIAGALVGVASYIGGVVMYSRQDLTFTDVLALLALSVVAMLPAAVPIVAAIRTAAPTSRLRFTLPGWAPLAMASSALLTALFGVDLAAAFSVFGASLFFAGLAELIGVLLLVPQTTAPWRAGLALVVAPFLAYGLFMGTYVVSGHYLPPTRWEIPDGYRGYVMTAYGISTCRPLPKDLLVSVVTVDAKGHACTSDVLPNGYTEFGNEYVYVRSDGAKVPIPRVPFPNSGDVISVPSVWGSVDVGDGKCPRRSEFFVGTRDDERAAPKAFDRTDGLGCDLKPLRP